MSNTIQINLGNNESATRGIFTNADGTFTALTFSASRVFKSKAGAIKWLAKRLA